MYSGHIPIPYFKIYNINKQETTTYISTKDGHENPNGQRKETEVTVVISGSSRVGLYVKSTNMSALYTCLYMVKYLTDMNDHRKNLMVGQALRFYVRKDLTPIN